MSADHLLSKIRAIDENIKLAEDRAAAEAVRIGNFKREREALFANLTDEEKKALSPEPPETASAPIVAPEVAPEPEPVPQPKRKASP